MPNILGKVPAVFQEFVEDLGRFQLGCELGGNGSDDRFENFVHPFMCNDLERHSGFTRHGTVGLNIVEHTLGLILADVHARQSHEFAVMVAGINDLWSDDQVCSIKVGGHLEFTNFEAKIIQAADALSDSPLLVGFNNFRSGEFIPQLQVARANSVTDFDGIFIAGEERSRLKVH